MHNITTIKKDTNTYTNRNKQTNPKVINNCTERMAKTFRINILRTDLSSKLCLKKINQSVMLGMANH